MLDVDDSVFEEVARAVGAVVDQAGVGLAAAILIDATIVRAVLVPSVMKLLGDKNWYLPGWLEWGPRLTAEPAAGPKPPAGPTPSPGT